MSDFGSTVAVMQLVRRAAFEGNFFELKRLCKEKGLNINEAGPESGRTALHWGAGSESNEIVSYLLNGKQAAVDPLDSNLDTPLNLIIQTPTRLLQKKLAVIQTLLAHGADATLPNRQGQTPLMSLIHLRDNIPPTHYFQLKNINAVIARIKENIYQKSQQPVAIYPNGQVIVDARAYNPPVPAVSSLYLPKPDPSRAIGFRYR